MRDPMPVPKLIGAINQLWSRNATFTKKNPQMSSSGRGLQFFVISDFLVNGRDATPLTSTEREMGVSI